ncbi:EboA domain-containing protein [Flammeovirgaceae bacterium SG7u.111]|nr:EboA domain-containing protein [Flammeovirgaceae bacterium SG7u.132]WPO36848.1 EboA domain-containing protein [Flammeovirgaceae bacterium SG7u.111]
MIYQAPLDEMRIYLRSIIEANTNEKGKNWLAGQEEKLELDSSERALYMAFGAAPRFVGKEKLVLTQEQLKKAATLRKGFDPNGWTVDQAARTWIVLSLSYEEKSTYLATLDKLFETGDVREQAALYAALPLLPQPEWHVKRAAEGVRTNMTVVLDAVALNNPFPADYFDDLAWNQLVLKSIFTERPVYKIYHADERGNIELSKILLNYAHERWAASRAVTPELWRFCGKYMSKEILADLEKVLENGSEIEKKAVILTSKDSHRPEAALLALKEKKLAKELEESGYTWDDLGRELEASKAGLGDGAYQQAGSGFAQTTLPKK